MYIILKCNRYTLLGNDRETLRQYNGLCYAAASKVAADVFSVRCEQWPCDATKEDPLDIMLSIRSLSWLYTYKCDW
jgi:hypothetical protein